MSRLIGISDGRFIAADFVAEIKADADRQLIMVRMKDGQVHAHRPDYGSSIYRSADALIVEINTALAAYQNPRSES